MPQCQAPSTVPGLLRNLLVVLGRAVRNLCQGAATRRLLSGSKKPSLCAPPSARGSRTSAALLHSHSSSASARSGPSSASPLANSSKRSKRFDQKSIASQLSVGLCRRSRLLVVLCRTLLASGQSAWRHVYSEVVIQCHSDLPRWRFMHTWDAPPDSERQASEVPTASLVASLEPFPTAPPNCCAWHRESRLAPSSLAPRPPSSAGSASWPGSVGEAQVNIYRLQLALSWQHPGLMSSPL